MRLTLSLLGSFHASWRQNSLEFATDSARGLLAYLAVEGDRPQQRETLAALFWPDRPQAAAYTNLRQTLARLRKALQAIDSQPHPLLISSKCVQFQAAAADIDVIRFEERCSAAAAHPHPALTSCPVCIAHLRAAVDLYRGDFLQDLYLDRARLFEEWVQHKREQLRRQALDMLHTLTLHAGEQADYTQMAHFAARQLALEPWREEAHRQMMWALAASGQTSAALAHYAACCRALADELDTTPSLETTMLYERIRSGAFVQPRETPFDAPPTASKAKQETQESTKRIPVVVSPPPPTYQILGEVPNVPVLLGRQNEWAQLVAWIAYERCQVVTLWGMGGVGKTSLAASVAQAVAKEFDTVIWRSLHNAPPIEECLRACLQILARHDAVALPTSLDEQLTLLLSYLHQQRCLLILDNLESVLSEGPNSSYRTDTYRKDYEGYSQLIQRLAESRHPSTLLLTSRERPKGLARLEEDMPSVRSLRLAGLDAPAGQALLMARGLDGDTAQLAKLVAYYSGNPLALKVVAETVHDLFGGDIGAFLSTERAIFDDIRTVLDQHFEVLSPIERELLLWLAIEREPVTMQTLCENVLHPHPPHLLMEALRSLERRSLLEVTRPGRTAQGNRQATARFTLQNVVMEHVAERLVEAISREIEEGRLDYLHSHALLKARAQEYVRRSQTHMLLDSIVKRSMASLGQERWRKQIAHLLALLHESAQRLPSYAAGNLLNLLLHAKIDVQGYDFSGLSIWQAYLQDARLHDVDFRGADFRQTTFTHLFGNILTFQLQNQGQLLVAGSAGDRLRVWRLMGVQTVEEYPSPAVRPVAATFSPDGQTLAILEADQRLSLWEVARGRLLQTFSGHTHFIWAIAFTLDGSLVATGGADHTVRVWSVQSDQARYVLTGHANAVASLAFSPDGRWLASGSVDGSICLWDVEQGTLRHCWQAHEDEVHVLLFDAASTRLISGSHDSTIRVWQADLTAPLHTLQGHIGPVRTLAMSADGRILASGGGDTFVVLWNIQTGQRLHTLIDLEYPTVLLAFSPDGQRLARIGTDPRVTLWDTQTWQCLDTLPIYTNPIYSLAFSPTGEALLSGSADGTLCLWEVSSGQIKQRFQSHAYGVTKVAFSPDSKTLASGSDDRTVSLWHVQNALPRHQWHGHGGRVECLQFHPTGDWLATGSGDRTLRLWDVRRGVVAHILNGHHDRVLTCAFHPTGDRLASAGMDRTIRLWSTRSGEWLATLAGHTNAVNGLAYSHDGRVLASSSYDCTVRLWEAESGRPKEPVIQLETVVLALAFHPSEPILALGCADHTIRLWHLPTARVVNCLLGHSGTVESIAFSPDGRLLASCSVDETIRLWDMTHHACLQTLRMPGPYAGMKIGGITGMSEAQQMALKMLGAVDDPG